jgi:hypothetical protein
MIFTLQTSEVCLHLIYFHVVVAYNAIDINICTRFCNFKIKRQTRARCGFCQASPHRVISANNSVASQRDSFIVAHFTSLA